MAFCLHIQFLPIVVIITFFLLLLQAIVGPSTFQDPSHVKKSANTPITTRDFASQVKLYIQAAATKTVLIHISFKFWGYTLCAKGQDFVGLQKKIPYNHLLIHY